MAIPSKCGGRDDQYWSRSCNAKPASASLSSGAEQLVNWRNPTTTALATTGPRSISSRQLPHPDSTTRYRLVAYACLREHSNFWSGARSSYVLGATNTNVFSDEVIASFFQSSPL